MTPTTPERAGGGKPPTLSIIEHLSEYMAYSGKTYKNHLAIMECWKKEDMKKEQVKENVYSYNGSFKEGDSL